MSFQWEIGDYNCERLGPQNNWGECDLCNPFHRTPFKLYLVLCPNCQKLPWRNIKKHNRRDTSISYQEFIDEVKYQKFLKQFQDLEKETTTNFVL